MGIVCEGGRQSSNVAFIYASVLVRTMIRGKEGSDFGQAGGGFAGYRLTGAGIFTPTGWGLKEMTWKQLSTWKHLQGLTGFPRLSCRSPITSYFFPESVEYWYSTDGQNYQRLDILQNQRPLTKTSKINDIQYFVSSSGAVEARYIKIVGRNKGVAPVWHHAAGLPVWIFIDEVMVE